MAGLSMKGSGSAAAVAALLEEEIPKSGLSCELVESIRRTVGQSAVHLMVFEKYYMRASNRASLTVMVTENNGEVFVDAVGSGGGQGAIFRFSWGAEEDFVGAVSDLLSGQGFR